MAVTVIVNSPFNNDTRVIGDTFNINFSVQDDGTDNISYSIKVKDASDVVLKTLVGFTVIASPNTINYDVTVDSLVFANKVVVEIGDYGSVVVSGFSGPMTYDGVMGNFYVYSYAPNMAVNDKVENIVISNSGN